MIDNLHQPTLKDTAPCVECSAVTLNARNGNTWLSVALTSDSDGLWICYPMVDGWACRQINPDERASLAQAGHRFYSQHDCRGAPTVAAPGLEYIFLTLRRSHLAIETGNGLKRTLVGGTGVSPVACTRAISQQWSAILTLAKQQKATPEAFVALRERFAEATSDELHPALDFYRATGQTMLELYLMALTHTHQGKHYA